MVAAEKIILHPNNSTTGHFGKLGDDATIHTSHVTRHTHNSSSHIGHPALKSFTRKAKEIIQKTNDNN